MAPLRDALAAGRLYDAEAWVAAGKPIQFAYPADRRRSPTSPLQVAIESGGHDAVLLLLCNGYRMALERASPLKAAFRARRLDVLRLLLDWGADPLQADPNDVVSCYDADLVERFWRLGIDFSLDNALAGELAHATSNRPLYGFVKRRAAEDAVLQRELDRGLCFAVERREVGEHGIVEKAVQLCVWAGADPWHGVQIPFADEGYGGGDGDVAWHAGDCAAGRVAYRGRAELVPLLKLRAGAAHFQALYPLVRDAETFDALARIEPPRDMSRLIAGILSGLAIDQSLDRYGGTSLVRHLFDAGGRLQSIDDEEAGQLRLYIQTARDYSCREVVRMLQKPEHVEPSVFLRIIASPALIRRRSELGIWRSSLHALARQPDLSDGVRAALRRELGRVHRRGSGPRSSGNVGRRDPA